MKELLDVVTRVYEYQRPYPAIVGTASGLELESVRLALQWTLILVNTGHDIKKFPHAYSPVRSAGRELPRR